METLFFIPTIILLCLRFGINGKDNSRRTFSAVVIPLVVVLFMVGYGNGGSEISDIGGAFACVSGTFLPSIFLLITLNRNIKDWLVIGITALMVPISGILFFLALLVTGQIWL